jgi:hypothetical protein
LVAADVPATLRLVPGAGHGLPDSEDQYVYDFLNEQLSAPLLAGDLNCDGQVDFGDINPFVLALSAGETAYLQALPRCNWHAGDLNGDGLVEWGDINLFVDLLTGSQ